MSEWFRDAKFGIWSHWGPQSVPMFGDWSIAKNSTRPWHVSGEGSSYVKIEGFTEEQVAWREDDFRFVQKDGKIYAFIMCAKRGNTAVIKSLKEYEHIHSVRLLGYGSLTLNQYSGRFASFIKA